jgi:hypothetical protein
VKLQGVKTLLESLDLFTFTTRLFARQIVKGSKQSRASTGSSTVTGLDSLPKSLAHLFDSWGLRI